MNPMFLQLVFSFQQAAWMQLGKIANPISGKIEKNLDAAKMSIDMLIMVKEKTKGNLDTEEEKILANAITELELNYVAESKKETSDKK